MRLQNPEARHRKQDMLACMPTLQTQRLYPNLGDTTGQSCNRRASEATVVICEEYATDQAIEKVQSDGDVYIHLGVLRRYMQEDDDDEANKGENVLQDEELILPIP